MHPQQSTTTLPSMPPSRGTTDYSIASIPLPFCVDVVCLGTQHSGASAVYGGVGITPSLHPNHHLISTSSGRCCESFVVTVDGAPLVLFGAGHGVVREYMETFGGLVNSSSSSPQYPPTPPISHSPSSSTTTPTAAMLLPPYIFIPSNTSSAAAELPTLLAVERGKQKQLFEQRDHGRHDDVVVSSSSGVDETSDDDYALHGGESSSSSSSSLVGGLHKSRNHRDQDSIQPSISAHQEPFRITVIAQKGISESLELHRLAEAREHILARSCRVKARMGGQLGGQLCNFARLGISSRRAVIQTAFLHSPHPISTDHLVSEGFLTPVFRATLGANPLTSAFLRQAATKLLSNRDEAHYTLSRTPKESSNPPTPHSRHHPDAAAGLFITSSHREPDGHGGGGGEDDWVFQCDSQGNFPIIGSVTDVLLVGCLGVEGISPDEGGVGGSCGMTLWHERIGSASRNLNFNINDRTIQSRIRSAKNKLERRQVKCTAKRAALELKLRLAVERFAAIVATSPTSPNSTDGKAKVLADTITDIRSKLSNLTADEERLNAIDRAEVDRWSERYEVVLVPRRPLITITGDAPFTQQLMDELFLAQSPLASSSHQGSGELFILPCSASTNQHRGIPHNSNNHRIPYLDYYPDYLTHPFDNNAPDVARQAAILYGEVREAVLQAKAFADRMISTPKKLEAPVRRQDDVDSTVSPQQPPPATITVEEARERLATKQGSPKELRMYRRLLLVGKDPLATSVPSDSFFAGDSKVVKVIPGEITTEQVVAADKKVLQMEVGAVAVAPTNMGGGGADGITTTNPPSTTTAAPSSTSSVQNQSTSTLGDDGGGGGREALPDHRSSSDPLQNGAGLFNSLQDMIGWGKVRRRGGRGHHRVVKGSTQIPKAALIQWLSMFERACIETSQANHEYLPQYNRTTFLPPRVLVTGIPFSDDDTRSAGDLLMHPLEPGTLTPVSGEPYLTTAMLAIRQLHNREVATSSVPSPPPPHSLVSQTDQPALSSTPKMCTTNTLPTTTNMHRTPTSLNNRPYQSHTTTTLPPSLDSTSATYYNGSEGMTPYGGGGRGGVGGEEGMAASSGVGRVGGGDDYDQYGGVVSSQTTSPVFMAVNEKSEGKMRLVDYDLKVEEEGGCVPMATGSTSNNRHRTSSLTTPLTQGPSSTGPSSPAQTPVGFIQSPRPLPTRTSATITTIHEDDVLATSLIHQAASLTSQPKYHPNTTAPNTAVRHTKRVFFYSNENLSQRPKLILVPYLWDPTTDREYSQEPADHHTPPPHLASHANAVATATAPPYQCPCSIELLKERVGVALSITTYDLPKKGGEVSECPPDNTLATSSVDKLYLIQHQHQQQPPLLVSLGGGESPITSLTVATEVVSVTQLPPNSSVVATRTGGIEFNVNRLPFLLRTERGGGDGSPDEQVGGVSIGGHYGRGASLPLKLSASAFTSTTHPLVERQLSSTEEQQSSNTIALTPTPLRSRANHGSDNNNSSSIVVSSPPPSSRFSVQLRPISLQVNEEER